MQKKIFFSNFEIYKKIALWDSEVVIFEPFHLLEALCFQPDATHSDILPSVTRVYYHIWTYRNIPHELRKSEVFCYCTLNGAICSNCTSCRKVNFFLISTYFRARIIAYHLYLRRLSPRTVWGTHTIKTIHYHIELTVPSPNKS